MSADFSALWSEEALVFQFLPLHFFSSNDLVKNCSSSACFSTVYPKSAPSSSLCASAVPACVCFGLFFCFFLGLPLELSFPSFVFVAVLSVSCSSWRCRYLAEMAVVVCSCSCNLQAVESNPFETWGETRSRSGFVSTVCLCFLLRRLVNLVILRCSAGLLGVLQDLLI